MPIPKFENNAAMIAQLKVNGKKPKKLIKIVKLHEENPELIKQMFKAKK